MSAARVTGGFVAAVLGLVVAGPNAARADFVNGGFETGAFAPDWTASSGMFINNTQPHTGTYCAIFQAVPATLSQTVTTTPGDSYVLEFWLRNSNPNSDSRNSFVVNWNGSPVLTIPDSASISYTQYMVNVTATGSSTPVQFVANSYTNYWPLDDVHLAAVPEPSTVILLGVATPLVAGTLWRGRKHAGRRARSAPLGS